MSIKDSFDFRRLLDTTKLYFWSFARNVTPIEEFHSHQEELVKFIDNYVEEQRKEAVEAFKQTDEFLEWRIY